MKSQFTIGQTVKAVQFTDCFGKDIPETLNLTVSDIRLVEPGSMASYFRIKAVHADGYQFVEGAERFFAAQSVKGRSIYNALAVALIVLTLTFSAIAQGSRFNAKASVVGQQVGVGTTPDGHTKAGKAWWYCDAITKTGKRCKRHVSEAGLVCFQHKTKS